MGISKEMKESESGKMKFDVGFGGPSTTPKLTSSAEDGAKYEEEKPSLWKPMQIGGRPETGLEYFNRMIRTPDVEFSKDPLGWIYRGSRLLVEEAKLIEFPSAKAGVEEIIRVALVVIIGFIFFNVQELLIQQISLSLFYGD